MYAKLFASLYQGTLRGCSDEILVFTNLLAHADAAGQVDVHWKAISEETGLPQDRVKTAIANLEAPDADSRSPEEGGRRIMRMDEHRAWGWRIVNHAKYRAIRNEDDRREQNRVAQQRFREKNKPNNNQNKPSKPISAQAEAEAEAEAIKPSVASLPEWLNADIWADYLKHRGKKFAARAQQIAIKRLGEYRAAGHDPSRIIETSIANGWKGLFEPKGNGHGSTLDEQRAATRKAMYGDLGSTIEGEAQRVD